MTIPVTLGLIGLSAAVTGLFLANTLVTMMIGEINRKKSDDHLIAYFGFAPPKMGMIFQEYRSLYPEGRLHIYSLAAFGVTVVGLAVALLCIGLTLG